MQASEVASNAEDLLTAYKQLLLIDPFFRIVVEPADSEVVSECKPDGNALTWKLKLSPSRHQDLADVRYSVLDGLLRVLFAEMDRINSTDKSYLETRDAIIARLTSVLCNLLPADFEDDAEAEVSANQGG